MMLKAKCIRDNFIVPAEQVRHGLAALQAWALKEKDTADVYASGSGVSRRETVEAVLASRTFSQALDALGWATDEDNQLNILGLDQLREDNADNWHGRAMGALKGVPSDPSSLVFVSDDGDIFRWLFSDKTVLRQNGDITYVGASEPL